MRKEFPVCLAVGLFSIAAAAGAAAPEISNVWPDFVLSVTTPKIVTGENFGGEGFTLRVWSPKSDLETLEAAARALDGSGPKLPQTPPAGAAWVTPVDVERQVAVGNFDGVVLWAENKDGCSQPYLMNVAKPFWLSDAAARAGQLLHVYGFGIRRDHSNWPRYAPKPGTRICLKGGGRTLLVTPVLAWRTTGWITDTRLVYFRVPRDAPAGRYTVYVHNGIGGALGWAKAGGLEVLAGPAPKAKVFDARKYGATGDGLADDLGALDRAGKAAAEAGGGVVCLPPGTYRLTATLEVPAGVKLRGSGRENTLLRGDGYDAPAGTPLSAIVTLTDCTGLESLTVCGATGRGVKSDSLIQIVPSADGKPVEDVNILDCRLRAQEEKPGTRDNLYTNALSVNVVRRLNLNSNEIYGSMFFRWAERMEIIGNTWYNTASRHVIAIHGWAVDSLLDSNIFRDTPGRVCFYPVRHCYVRFNEVHQAFRGTWTNAEEIYLLHGTYQRERKTRGFATGPCTAATLVDPAKPWKPEAQKDSVVMILSGRGMGQYRRVTGNTADTLTLDRPWRVVPNKTSEYVTGLIFMENAYYANLNNTPLRMSLWLDVLGTVVERHRDAFSKGIDVWGSDNSRREPIERNGRPVGTVREFYPAWYNMIVNGWMDGAYAHLLGGGRNDNIYQGPPMFGNFIVANKIRLPHMRRTGFEHHQLARGGVVVGRGGRRGEDAGPVTRVGLSHNIIADNQVSWTDAGIIVGPQARKTFVLNNIFQRVDDPILDRGAKTVIRGNQIFAPEREGRVQAIPDSVGDREIPPLEPAEKP